MSAKCPSDIFFFLQNVKIGIKLRLFRQKWLNLTTNGGINAKGSDYWNALFCGLNRRQTSNFTMGERNSAK